jgi:hypothetical protein
MIFESSPNVTYINNENLNKFLKDNDSSILKTTSKINNNLGVIIIDIQETKNTNFITDLMFFDYSSENEVYPVTRSGLKYDNNCNEQGSNRFCTNSENLSEWLNNVIINSDAFPSSYENNYYEGVAAYFRVMKYLKGGMHFPHYDADYEYKAPYQNFYTAFSLIMYLSDCDSGELVFVDDNNENKEAKLDWSRQAKKDEIIFSVKPKIGRIVLFPHELCHSVMEFSEDNKERVMIRGDLIFKNNKEIDL